MMKFDRELQYKILFFLKEIYPDIAPSGTWEKLVCLAGNEKRLKANMRYLEGHGLLQSGIVSTVGEDMISESSIEITVKGIDFIMEDGGVGAILNTVTVRFHADAISQIERFLLQSSLNQQDKTGYIARLKELPSDATKHLAMKLVDLALNKAPEALQLIQKVLGSE